MRGIFLSRIARLGADERGTSLLEFAFAAPIFALMIVGLGDLARGFSQKFALQQAANRTIERAQMGSLQDDYNFLATEATNAAAAAGDPNATVTLTSWLECNGSTVAKAWTDTCANGEQTARYVKLEIQSNFRPMFGSAGYPGVNANGTVPIKVKASLRVQ